MGSTNFAHEIKAKSAREAFKMLEEEANYEYGNRLYNGSLNTCSFGSCKKKYDSPTKTNIKAAYKYIEDKGYGEKHSADYIDLGVIEYIVITAKKVHHSENKPVVRQRFVVREDAFSNASLEEKFVKDFETKKEADDYALRLAIKNNKRYIICKEGVVVSGNKKVSSIELEKKVYKTKPNLKHQDNRTIIPIHKYIFFGWASC